MKLEECYASFGGNYEDVQARLRSDVLIKKFVLKFLSDPTFGSLCAALDSKNYEEAFRAAHTLKGIAQNLSFKRLGESSSSLTEFLRGKADGQIDASQCASLFGIVKEDYDAVVEAGQMLS